MADDPRLPRLVLRGICALFLAIQGSIHLSLWRDGFAELPVIGPLFLAGALAAFIIALAVLATENLVVLGLGVLLSLGQIAAFVISSTVGLFGFESQWTLSGPEGAALLSEIFAAAALLILVRWRQKTGAGAYA